VWGPRLTVVSEMRGTGTSPYDPTVLFAYDI